MTTREPASFEDCPVCSDHPSGGYRRLATQLPIGHDGKAHRIYNQLYRLGFHGIERLGVLTDDELLDLPDLGPAKLERIRAVLPEPGTTGRAKSADDVRLLALAADHTRALVFGLSYELSRALAGAFDEAAENYRYCTRMNAKNRGRVTELPDPTAEALLSAAKILLKAG